MHEYRLYFFDRCERLTLSHEFIAEDNARAIRIAEGWREGRAMEPWHRDAKVRRWNFED